MTLGIMQPYFFPYLGYFDLIRATDRFVLFDTAQYIRHGWVNRNRILHPKTGWKYIIVPLEKHARTTPIRDIQVHASPDWRQTILGQLDHYRKRAPFFERTRDLVRDSLATDDGSLARLNGRCLERVCNLLGIAFRPEFDSQLQLSLPPIQHPGDWALYISRALGATRYVNPMGGAELFAPEKFQAAGIELVLRPFRNMAYTCDGYEFHAGLSIIDVLMWNEPDAIRGYLDHASMAHDGADGAAGGMG